MVQNHSAEQRIETGVENPEGLCHFKTRHERIPSILPPMSLLASAVNDYRPIQWRIGSSSYTGISDLMVVLLILAPGRLLLAKNMSRVGGHCGMFRNWQDIRLWRRLSGMFRVIRPRSAVNGYDLIVLILIPVVNWMAF